MKLETDSHVNQVGKLFFTQKFRKRTFYFAVLVLNQIHNNFHFHEAFSQNSFKTFIEKIKRLKGWLLKWKKYSVTCNQHVF